MNQHTMQFLDIIKTGSLEQTQYFYSLYNKCININVCAERPFRLACCRGYVDIASWLYYNISEMTIDITTMNHDAIHEAITSKTLSLDQKINIFHFLETIYRGIEDYNNRWCVQFKSAFIPEELGTFDLSQPSLVGYMTNRKCGLSPTHMWFNIGKILEYSIVNEAYDFAQYILQRYSSVAYDEIYGYAYNCFEHACINGNYMMAEKIRKIFEIVIPDDSAIYLNPNMQEYADYVSSDIMMKSFDMMKV